MNNYAPNIGEAQYIRKTLADIKGERDSNTIIVGDFNTQLTPLTDHQKRELIRNISLK